MAPVAGDLAFYAGTQSGDTPGQSSCPARYASVNLAQLDIPAAADAPPLAVRLSQPVPPTRESPFVAKLPAHAEPPPLCIVHYCLRN